MDAALADLEARKAEIENMIAGIRKLQGQGTQAPTGGPGGGIRPDSFLGMSIPDATKKLLEAKRTKLSTQEVIDGLVQGGLPESKYNTVYGVLSRREKQVGDIINMKGDWALTGWYPNRPKGKPAKDVGNDSAKSEPEAATA